MSSASHEPLLTLKQASERLNVHPTTVRRWSDQGKIKVMVTPGGHRRFPLSEVERLLTRRGGGVMPRQEEQMAQKMLSHTRSEIVHHQEAPWLAALPEEEREEKRETGRRLMGLMMQYISMDEDDGEHYLQEARAIGHLYGSSARASGRGLRETLAATMFFRDNIVESAIVLPDSVRLHPEANRRLLRRINAFLNTIQLAIADAYNAEAEPGMERRVRGIDNGGT